VQLRHLRYFVSIVDAGSFSRAATTIHVAQPALSQQIADLEARLGVALLHRSARGVRPTPAGEALYREATAIMRRIEQLPAIVRATDGEIAGTVSIGVSTTLAASLAGPLMEVCRSTWPGVSLRFVNGDSLFVKARIEAGALDLGLVFEDETGPGFTRQALFRHRLYLVRHDGPTEPISLRDVAALPLIMPAHPNATRSLLDRAFAAAGVRPTIAVETDVLSAMLSAVQSGLGCIIIPKGDLSDVSGHANLVAQPIEPPLYLIASVVAAAEAAPSRAVDAVRAVVADLIETRFAESPPPGAEWTGSHIDAR
jgi:LysR family nitrogen assimilation transcriptional regulator